MECGVIQKLTDMEKNKWGVFESYECDSVNFPFNKQGHDIMYQEIHLEAYLKLCWDNLFSSCVKQTNKTNKQTQWSKSDQGTGVMT